MEDAEAQINFNGEILKLYNSKPLHAISAFKVLLETNNLTLTEIDGKAKSSN